MSGASVDQNAVNAVFYALSTVAQTCAALAALVGALALYKLQSMREAHAGNERRIREFVAAHLPAGRATTLDAVLQLARTQAALEPSQLAAALVVRLRAELTEREEFAGRYKRAVGALLLFEAWNLFAILVSLIGFIFSSWLASRWVVFASMLILISLVTVAVTGGALYAMARRDEP